MTSRFTELARLLGLGAAKVDVGQDSGRSWVVMADPEGNASRSPSPPPDAGPKLLGVSVGTLYNHIPGLRELRSGQQSTLS
ncbi:VOC family protein [Microbispora rosea]|uniref:VOC family protein n=1 Tax=Microbispora rosea TaxID=58117 RepID=UPI003F4E0105